MPINSNIPLSIRPVEIESPLNKLALVSRIQESQQNNELNRMQIDAARTAAEEDRAVRNYLLTNPDLNSSEGQNRLLSFGKTGMGYSKAIAEQRKAGTEAQKADTDLVEAKLKQSRQFLSGITTPEQFVRWSLSQHSDPILGPVLRARGVTPEKTMQGVEQALAQPDGFQTLMQQSALGMDEYIKQNAPKYTSQDLGGQARIVAVPGLGGAASVVPGSEAARTLTPDQVADNARSAALLGETGRHNWAMEGNAAAAASRAGIPAGYERIAGVLRPMAGGPADPATKLTQPKVVPQKVIDELASQSGSAEGIDRLSNTFKDEYGGNLVAGGLENTARRLVGDETGQGQWWQDYALQANKIRNELFGSALTAPELAAFEAATITPRMNSAEIKKNLARQKQLADTALNKLVKASVANYKNPEVIEAATGGRGMKPADAGAQKNIVVDW